MFEKVSPSHPDKIADRIAGALVDLAYEQQDNPKVAVEVLIGHNKCFIINETSVCLDSYEVKKAVARITNSEVNTYEKDGSILLKYIEVPQDTHLADNQSKEIKCGDNGIFKGVPRTEEQIDLSLFARHLYAVYPYDGKYIIDGDEYIVCHSNVKEDEISNMCPIYTVINPLGEWTGGINVDSGATNRKLGSDMGDSVTGGGLHGKDLSKADVSVNIYCWCKAQELEVPVTACCAIGDTYITFYYNKNDDGYASYTETVLYKDIVEFARNYIIGEGGFEHFAEWGLI